MVNESNRWMPAGRRGVMMIAWLAAAVATMARDEADPLRLRHHPVEPVAQAIELRLDPAADGYTGRAIVDLVVHESTREIRLHAQDLDLGAIAVTARGTGATVDPTATRGEIGLLTLTTPADLAPGAYQLSIEFTGRYRDDGAGLYKTVVDGAPYLFTQFEARWGRTAFPCWDEPAFKIPWRVTLRVPESLEAFSNGEAVLESRADGWRTLEFARTPPMSSYLVAVAVGPFETVAVPGLAVPGRIITARGQSGLTGAFAGETPRILATLEDYFGLPYPYGKLDQVAVPEFTWGGMENAGLITYRDTVVLRAPGDDDLTRRRHLVQIVAHEIAHHWFGNLVTMEWWNDLWLNESFASWMEGKVIELAYPEFRYKLHALPARQWAMRIDALPSTGPVRRAITAADDPETFVDALSYQKGEAVLTMVEAWIGPGAFRAAMTRYFDEHRWGNTRGEDLWAAFGAASGDDVPAMVASFIEQPGVPHLTIDVLAGDRVRLRQRRYAALGGDLPPGADRALWHVPVVLRYEGNDGVRTARVLLREREQIVAVPGISAASWILPNAGESGYYRWQLEPAREQALVQAAPEALEPVERLGLQFNAAALHDAGELAPSRYLAQLVEGARDHEPDVASRAVDGLLRMRAIYLDDADAAAFARFLRTALSPVLVRIGAEARPGEAPEVAGLRRGLITALGVRGGDPEIVALSQRLAARLIEDPRSVDAGLAPAVLTVAAWHGDAAFFDRCEQAFRAARVPTDREMFLAALGGFSEAGLCERALTLSLAEGLRSHERLDIAWVMAGGSFAHRQRVVAWLMEHFDAIRALTSEHAVSELIGLAEGSDAALFARARAFLLEPNRVSDLAAKNIAEASDRDAQRQALRARGQAEVRAVLADPGLGRETAGGADTPRR